MRKKQIVICDSNTTYARRLQEYLAEQRILPCSIAFYTDWDKFVEHIKKNTLAVCVVSEDIPEEVKEELQKVQIQKVLILYEDDADVGEAGIYRYQSADKFVERLCSLADLKESRINIDNDIQPTYFF